MDEKLYFLKISPFQEIRQNVFFEADGAALTWRLWKAGLDKPGLGHIELGLTQSEGFLMGIPLNNDQ